MSATTPAVVYAAALPTPRPIAGTTGGTNPYSIRLTFNEIIDPATAGTLANYTISGGVMPNNATLSDDSLSVYVATTGLVPGQKYTVNVSGIRDQAQTPNTMDPVVLTVRSPVMNQGVNWDFYPNISPQGVANLVGNPRYQGGAPYASINIPIFDSTLITGGDLNNQPGFTGGLGENYGASLAGWITPTVTTNYYFFIASDDASELYLSGNADPGGASLIAYETSCCHGFQDPGNPTTSLPQLLTAGVSYYICALQTEGGGGDYVKVAWKMEGDPTASADLVPISGSVLKAYAPLPPPQFNPPSYNAGSGQLTISWVGDGTLYQSIDLIHWTPVQGNPSSPYVVNVNAAEKLFYAVVVE